MKHLIILLTVITTFSACNLVADYNKKKTEESSSTSTSKVNPEPDYTADAVFARDLSIDSSNAYSDLFLDSVAVESFIKAKNVGDSMANKLRNFYNVRNYQYAWFNTDGFTEQGRGFWNLYDEESPTADSKGNRKLSSRMDSLLENDTLLIAATDTSFAQTELQITQHYLQFAQNNLAGNTIKGSEAYYLIPAKKTDAMTLADSLINKQSDSLLYNNNKTYSGLRQQLSVYYNAAKSGGWQTLSGIKNIKKGANSPAIVLLKKRLAATGDYISTDTSSRFTDSLSTAIKSVQQRNGLSPTGIVTDSLLRVLNVPAEKRVEQIIVNMNRALWMPTPKDSNYIMVNVPDFMLYVYDSSHKVFDMPVVVGKEGTNTMMFTGSLNQIVFSPYWNIPASIVQRDILPAMKKDKDYLKKHHMEIVSQNDSLPVIRQLPGEENSLGKAKFLFPNSYDIYFHDTPSKGIFEKSNRAASHGCIRLANAEQMADYLLRDQSNWTPQKIKEAMNSGKEQKVVVTNPVPVLINYYTAWVDENGQLNFRNDVYGHDLKTQTKMFQQEPVKRIS